MDGDSLRMANSELDRRVEELLHKADSSGTDIVIIRKYNNYNCFGNQCRIMTMRDSCSVYYALNINDDYSIGYISINRRDRRHQSCVNDFPAIEKDLEGHFTAKKPQFSAFSSDNWTLTGVINGRYLLELIDPHFLDEHRPGMFYHTLTGYFGLYKGW